MDMPGPNASVEVLLDLADHLLAKLRGDPAAAHIAAELEPRIVALRAAAEGKRAATEAADAAESQLWAAESAVEDIIRRIAASLLAVVKRDAKRSPYVDVFPRNLEGALVPRGAAQAAESRRIIGVIQPSTGPAPANIPGEVATIVAELREATTALDTKVTAAEGAASALVSATTSELGERRRIREQYRKSYGLLTAVYPSDRKKVESFFKKAGKPPKKKGPGTPPTT